MTTKVLVRNAVLLLIFPIFETFATTVQGTWTSDPILDLDIEIPALIGRHRQKSIAHRIKRDLWKVFRTIADTESTTTETWEKIAEVTTDSAAKAFLEAVETKSAGIDNPNVEFVHQLTSALKDSNASNEILEKEYTGLQTRISELGKTVADYHRRISHLEAILSDRFATRSASPEQKIMEFECRAFVTDLIIARKKYFP